MSIEQTTLNTQPQIKSPSRDGAVKAFPSNGRSLGTSTGFASAILSNPNENNASAVAKTAQNNTRKYKLQELALKHRPNSRLSVCMKTRTDEFVQLHYNDENQHAHYRGLMRCDKYWECPVCSSRYTSRQAEDVRKAYAHAVDVNGWHVAMVTYTMSHRKFDKLAENIAVMRESRRSMRSGGWWQRFKDDFGYEGCISAMEVTYGFTSGWHVHVHELMFLSSDYVKEFQTDDHMRLLESIVDKRLSRRWVQVVKNNGKSASLEHGINVRLQDKYVAEYVAKEGCLPESVTWDTALELTKAMTKISKGGLHPFQILELSGDTSVPEQTRKQMKALWLEYVNAFDGRAMFYWTEGLKDALLIEEVAEGSEETKESDTIINIPSFIWSDVVYLRKRAELLNECILARGDPQILHRWLNDVHRLAQQSRPKEPRVELPSDKIKPSVDYEANRRRSENAPKGTMSPKARLLKELKAKGYGK